MDIEEPAEDALLLLPTGSRIGICLMESDQLALDIPPGNHASSLGRLAVLWNSFIAVFTIGLGSAFRDDLFADFSILIGLFWVVGAGLIFAWVRLRFERSVLFVDRERAVLQQILFGRQRRVAADLGETSRAALTLSHVDEYRPVCRVSIVGGDGDDIHFGTSLDQSDKEWCVDAINAVLQPQAETQDAGALICEACGAVLPADANRTVSGDWICPECSHQQSSRSANSQRSKAALEPDET